MFSPPFSLIHSFHDGFVEGRFSPRDSVVVENINVVHSQTLQACLQFFEEFLLRCAFLIETGSLISREVDLRSKNKGFPRPPLENLPDHDLIAHLLWLTGCRVEVSDTGVERRPHQVGLARKEHAHPNYRNADPGLPKGAIDEFPLPRIFVLFFPIGWKAHESSQAGRRRLQKVPSADHSSIH